MNLLKKTNKVGKYISFGGKRYALNFERLKEVCLTSSSDGVSKEMEITQVYEPDSIGEFSMTSRVEHETKVNKNPQNDLIIYEIVKLLILSLLENNNIEDGFKFDFSTAFAVNTLLSWGVLEELSEE
jgi:hypothetical protein